MVSVRVRSPRHPVRTRVRTLLACGTAALTIVAAVAVGAVGSVGRKAGASSAPAPIHVLPDAVGFSGVVDVSADGRFAIVVDANGGRYHVALPVGGEPTLVPGAGVAEDGGVFVDAVDGPATVIRTRVATGEVTSIAIPLPTDRPITAVADADPSGRFIVVGVRLPSGRRASYVYDTLSGELDAPLGASDVAVDGNPTISSISADGRHLHAQQTTIVGATLNRRWFLHDRVTGSDVVSRTVDEPFPGGTLRVSDDFEWGVFITQPPGATAAVNRINFVTGETDVVPIDPARLSSYAVVDGGRVVVGARDPAAADPVEQQLYMWEGSGPMVMLTVGVDGEPADRGIDNPGVVFRTSPDGSRVTFISSSTNLAVGASTAASRLYQVVLPPAPASAPAAPLVPDESYCVPARGAEPGDFVAVNVTPVGASTYGHGLLHSSDERPGTTATVNFRPAPISSNTALVRVGVDGEICFTNGRDATVDVVLDQLAVADHDSSSGGAPFAGFGLRRARIVDTRLGLGGALLAPFEQRCFDVAPTDPGSWIGLDVTPVGATTSGYGTVHPSGASPGTTATVNFGPGTAQTNFALVRTGAADGAVCFTNGSAGTVELIVDSSVVASAADLAPAGSPSAFWETQRLVDTRIGLGGQRIAPAASLCVATQAAPGDAIGVDLTPIGATSYGYGTLHASDDPVGPTANVNVGPGTLQTSFAITTTGPDGHICFTNAATSAVDVVIDATITAPGGWIDAPTGAGAVRLTDTRTARS